MFTWKNRITLKYKVYQGGADRRMKLQAAPDATIRYTTDGSDPRLAGAVYEDDFFIPHGSPMVLAYAERDGIESDVEKVPLDWKQETSVAVDPKRPATWKRKHGFNSTKESYELLGRLQKHTAKASGLTITISGEGSDKEWVELTMYEGKRVKPVLVEECLQTLRKLQGNGQVQLAVEALHFDPESSSGQALGQSLPRTRSGDLLDWVEEVRTTLQSSEVKQ